MQNFIGTPEGKTMNETAPLKPFQALRAYWEALRLNGALPDRSRIDPRGLADHLEHIILVERIAPGHCRLRLAGSAVHDVLGMEARGMPLTAILEPASRTKLSERLDAVFDEPAILDIWLTGERGIGRPALTGRLLLLPLANDGQRSKGEAIGCLLTSGMIGRTPRRFAETGMTRERIATGGLLAHPVSPKPSWLPHEGFADQPRDFAAPTTRSAAKSAAHLRLVHSRD
jgi:hypothetical protein